MKTTISALSFFTILIALLFVQCGKDQTTINGTNQESFDASIDAMQRELDSDQAPKLREAITLIYKYKTPDADAEEMRWSRTRQLLNLKNSDEIFDMAERIAQQKNINWDRNSLGNLQYDRLPNADFQQDRDSTNIDNTTLASAKSMVVSSKELDRNLDGVYDGIMVFYQLKDDKNTELQYDNAAINTTINVLNEGERVMQKTVRIESSKVGDIKLNRGIFLPYSAIPKGQIQSDKVDIEVSISADNIFLKAEDVVNPIHYNEYVLANNISEEEQENDKKLAMATVSTFLNSIESKDYRKAHNLSVNPDWRDYNVFTSDDLGFGAIENMQVGNIVLKSYDPQKEKAVVNGSYSFNLKGNDADNQRISLSKTYHLQKIAGDWKIVSAKKIN